MAKKTWLVEQWWCARGIRVPVRATVEAKTERKARKKAEDACREAAMAIGAAKLQARPKGEAVVLGEA